MNEMDRKYQYNLGDAFFRLKHIFLEYDYRKDWSFGLDDLTMDEFSRLLGEMENIVNRTPLRQRELRQRYERT